MSPLTILAYLPESYNHVKMLDPNDADAGEVRPDIDPVAPDIEDPLVSWIADPAEFL
jgi:hypothetical protein